MQTPTSSKLHLQINQWLEIARFASSIHNIQPWRVLSSNAELAHADQLTLRIALSNDPAHRDILLAPDLRLNYCSLGCLAGNLIEIAELNGYQNCTLKEVLSPQSDMTQFALTFQKNHTSAISPAAVQSKLNSLTQRRVNRLPYFKKPLTSLHKGLILQCMSDFPEQNIHFFEGDSAHQAAHLLTQAEKFLYSTPATLDAWINGFHFGKDAQNMTEGIHPDSLGVGFLTKALLKILKSQARLRPFYQFFGASLTARIASRRLMRHSSGLVFLSATHHGPATWFHLGRNFQKIWNLLNTQAVSLQPMMAGCSAMQALGDHAWESHFSSKKIKKIIDLRSHFRNSLGIDLSNPTVVFRIGYAKTRTTPSPRRNLRLEMED